MSQPQMPVTLDLLEALIARGWTITGRRVGNATPLLEYRDPNGASGSTYQTVAFEQFPTVVAKWIWENVPMTPNPPGDTAID